MVASQVASYCGVQGLSPKCSKLHKILEQMFEPFNHAISLRVVDGSKTVLDFSFGKELPKFTECKLRFVVGHNFFGVTFSTEDSQQERLNCGSSDNTGRR